MLPRSVSLVIGNPRPSGGLAAASFNAGTDGGATGTGRAGGALTYTGEAGGLDLRLQSQTGGRRIPGAVDGTYGLSVGGSLTYEWGWGLEVGAAFNHAPTDGTTDELERLGIRSRGGPPRRDQAPGRARLPRGHVRRAPQPRHRRELQSYSGWMIPRPWIEALPGWSRVPILDHPLWKWLVSSLLIVLGFAFFIVVFRLSLPREEDDAGWVLRGPLLAVLVMVLARAVDYLIYDQIGITGDAHTVIETLAILAFWGASAGWRWPWATSWPGRSSPPPAFRPAAWTPT